MAEIEASGIRLVTLAEIDRPPIRQQVCELGRGQILSTAAPAAGVTDKLAGGRHQLGLRVPDGTLSPVQHGPCQIVTELIRRGAQHDTCGQRVCPREFPR